MKKILFTTFILFPVLVVGATKKVVKLQNSLTNQTNQVSILASQIKNLDKRLIVTNDNYLENEKRIAKLEKKLEKLKTTLQLSAESISVEFNQSQKALNLYLLETTDIENEDAVLHREVYLKLAKQKIKKLAFAQKKSNELLETINTYDQHLSEKKSDEKAIYDLIVELENRKKTMSQTYISKLESKNRLEFNLDKIKAKRTIRNSQVKKKNLISTYRIPMNLPLNNYLEVKRSKKAIVLKYSQSTPVIAPSSGRIVYTGQLASYGNLIMIDHGREIKSVLLGDMHIKIKKGETVKKGDILGYTIAEPGLVKPLHYEIRRKKSAVNAFNWITNKQNLKI